MMKSKLRIADETDKAQSINNIYLGKAEVVLIINALRLADIPGQAMKAKEDLIQKLLKKGENRR